MQQAQRGCASVRRGWGGAAVGRVGVQVRTAETEVRPEDASRTGAWRGLGGGHARGHGHGSQGLGVAEGEGASRRLWASRARGPAAHLHRHRFHRGRGPVRGARLRGVQPVHVRAAKESEQQRARSGGGGDDGERANEPLGQLVCGRRWRGGGGLREAGPGWALGFARGAALLAAAWLGGPWGRGALRTAGEAAGRGVCEGRGPGQRRGGLAHCRRATTEAPPKGSRAGKCGKGAAAARPPCSEAASTAPRRLFRSRHSENRWTTWGGTGATEQRPVARARAWSRALRTG